MKFTNALGGCANCGALTSPCWRKGPEDAKHLCNACGSRYLVKGTLEGYKPGQKNRSGGKRSKLQAQKPSPSSPYSHSQNRQDPQKRIRLFKDTPRLLTYEDKAVQVDPAELESMPPFTRMFSDEQTAYLESSSSPKSHYERIKQEHIKGSSPLPGIKDSSDESSPESELIAASPPAVHRRRARKPFKPISSGW